MIGMAVSDQAERDRLTSQLGATLFIEAGAGTGKTTAVVSRIVALVGAGRVRMERLVAITFTVAAAGELRVRIREGLEDAVDRAGSDAERERLRVAAGEVDRARIETIHAFCSALLHMHPLEAGVPPDVQTLASLAATIDLRERFRQWFDELDATSEGAAAVQMALQLGLKPARLLELFTVLNENWDLIAGATWTVDTVHAVQVAHRTADGIDDCVALLPYGNAADELYCRVDGLRLVATRLRDAVTDGEAVAALATFLAASTGNTGRQGDWRTAPGGNACRLIKDTLSDARIQVIALLTAARSAALAAVACELRGVVLEYADERRRRGLVSYQDLLVRARDLVRDHPDVCAALRDRWDFVAVDEFQDTDPLQAELAFRLCASADQPGAAWTELRPIPGRLCIVGDPKQSIYRFRRADIALYADVERSLLGADPDARVRLSVNFRSGRTIIDAVNAVFGGDGLMTQGQAGTRVQAQYADLDAHAPEIDGSVTVIGGLVDGRAPEMWRQEAAAAAAAIRTVIDTGFEVGEGTPGGPRPCRPRDVCILMPSRTNLRNMERALENARVRYRLESGSLIVSTQEVRDLLNILRCIDDSSDEVALMAALRSPAYGCSDVELVRWKTNNGRWSYQHPGDGREPRVAAALEHLASLHAARQRMSVPRLIDEVLGSRLLRAAAVDDWRPREALRRYRFVADQARALAAGGRSSLHDAVDYLELLTQDPSYDSITTDDADDDPCVRIMTIHAAKGLEFPIVVVTGLGRKAPPQRPVLIVDRAAGTVELRISPDFFTAGWADLDTREKEMDEAERIRLLYVALTRARDHLVVSLFRATGTQDNKTEAGKLAARLKDLPGVTELVFAPSPPAAENRPSAPDAADPAAHLAAELEWQAARRDVVHTLGVTRSMTATGLAHEDGARPPGALPEDTPDLAATRRGRGATSLGRAVHAVLQVVDLATGSGLDALATIAAAAEGLSDRAPDVARLARAAWESDAVRRAAAARNWREVPLGATVDGVVLEGFVDLLYELPDGRLVVVDYKTDSVASGGIDRRMADYAIQGGVYALLVTATTGREVAGIEFVFAAPGETRTITDVAGVVAEVRTRLAAAGPV